MSDAGRGGQAMYRTEYIGRVPLATCFHARACRTEFLLTPRCGRHASPRLRRGLGVTDQGREGVVRAIGEITVCRKHRPSHRCEFGVPAFSAAFGRRDQRRSKAAVHRAHQKPRAPIAHSHRAAGCRNRTVGVDRVEQIGLSRAHRDNRICEYANADGRPAGSRWLFSRCAHGLVVSTKLTAGVSDSFTTR